MSFYSSHHILQQHTLYLHLHYLSSIRYLKIVTCIVTVLMTRVPSRCSGQLSRLLQLSTGLRESSIPGVVLSFYLLPRLIACMYNIVSSQGTVKYRNVVLTPLLSPLDRNNGVMLSQYHLTSSEPGPKVNTASFIRGKYRTSHGRGIMI